MTAPPVITNEDGVVDSSCSPLTPGARATCGRGVTIGDSSCAGSSSRAARRQFCCGHGAGSNLPEPERTARLPRIAGVVQRHLGLSHPLVGALGRASFTGIISTASPGWTSWSPVMAVARTKCRRSGGGPQEMAEIVGVDQGSRGAVTVRIMRR